jgi:hypothetical protein
MKLSEYLFHVALCDDLINILSGMIQGLSREDVSDLLYSNVEKVHIHYSHESDFSDSCANLYFLPNDFRGLSIGIAFDENNVFGRAYFCDWVYDASQHQAFSFYRFHPKLFEPILSVPKSYMSMYRKFFPNDIVHARTKI